MQNNDAFKLLYSNLWIAKSELPEYLKVSPIASPDTQSTNKSQIYSSLRIDKLSAPSKDLSISGSSIADKVQDLAANLQSMNHLKAAMLNDKDQIDKSNTQDKTNSEASQTNKELIISWDKLTDLINNCTDCRLCNTRKNLVIERGNRNSQWMFIGEAPGENEDIQGLPFVGSAGQLLDKMLAAMKLDHKQDVYICNTVKCRPPQNRNPEADEIAQCNNYLLSQINLVKPKIIVVLGRIAAHTLLKTTQATSKLRNAVHYIEGNIPVIVTYHPAYLLRNPSAKKDTWEDLQLAMKTFATL